MAGLPEAGPIVKGIFRPRPAFSCFIKSSTAFVCTSLHDVSYAVVKKNLRLIEHLGVYIRCEIPPPGGGGRNPNLFFLEVP